MNDQKLGISEVIPQMTLVNVICGQLQVSREADGPAEGVKLGLNFGIAIQKDQVVVKVQEELHIATADEEPMASLSATFAVIYGLPDAETLLADNEPLQQQITTYAHMAAHPYIRAAFSDLSNQISLPRVTLGFLRQGSGRAESVTILDTVFSFEDDDTSSSVSE